MKVLYVPQRSDKGLAYEFEGDKITAHYEGEQEAFDFTAFPDGKLDDEGVDVGVFPINPIVGAERIDGELRVKLLYFHGKDATDAELFPEWKDAEVLEVGIHG